MNLNDFAISSIRACQANFTDYDVADSLEVYLKAQDFDKFFGNVLPIYSVGVYGINFKKSNQNQNIIWAVSGNKVLDHTKTLL